MTKTQVGHGYRTGFFGVVDKVALGMQIGAIPDYFDAVLVGADGSVRAQAIEQAFKGLAVLRRRVALLPGQAGVRDIIHNAHGEMIAGRKTVQIVKHRAHHARCELLGRQAEAAAHHPWHLGEWQPARPRRIQHRCGHILIQGITLSTGLLGSVQYGNGSGGGGQSGQ